VRQLVASILALTLCSQLFASPAPQTDARQQISSLSTGAKLKITTKTGEVLRGRLSSVEETTFTIIAGRAKKSHLIPFADVDHVMAQPKTHTPKGAWIAFGAIVGVVVIVVAAVLIERHNE
jgi:hypothetical protein